MSSCSALLSFKSTDYAYLWLSREWVAAVPCCISSLLMMPVLGSLACVWLQCLAMFLSLLIISVLGSPGCEWLQCIAMLQAYWWYLPLALQFVSGSKALLCFKSANDACPWLFSLWVAAMPCCVSSLLMVPVLGSSGSEWLQCLAVPQAYSYAYPWLSSVWVAAVPSMFQAYWWYLTLAF